MSQHNELATKLQGRIAKVSIQGFRGLCQIDMLELPQLTVLIEANGAGKSALIRNWKANPFTQKFGHAQTRAALNPRVVITPPPAVPHATSADSGPSAA